MKNTLKIKKIIIFFTLFSVSLTVVLNIENFSFNGDILSINKKVVVIDFDSKINDFMKFIKESNIDDDKFMQNLNELNQLFILKKQFNKIEKKDANLTDKAKIIIKEYYTGNISPLRKFNIEENENKLTIEDSSLLYLLKAQIEKENNKIEIYFKRSISIKKNFDNLYLYARYLYTINRNNEAYALYKEAIKFTNDDLNLAMAFNELGLVAESVTGFNEAIKYLNEAIDYKNILVIDNDTLVNKYFLANSLNNLANIFTRSGHFSKALINYEKALSIFVKNNFQYEEMVVRNGLASLYSEMIVKTKNNTEDIINYYAHSTKEYNESLKIAKNLKNSTFIIENYLEIAKLNNNYLSTLNSNLNFRT